MNYRPILLTNFCFVLWSPTILKVTQVMKDKRGGGKLHFAAEREQMSDIIRCSDGEPVEFTLFSPDNMLVVACDILFCDILE